jgi:chromosome segregation ATPase
MNRILLLTSLLIIFSYGPVSAEFYKYTDANGNVRYTDDLSKVPKSQRPNVTSYEESESSVPAAAPQIKSESEEEAEEAAIKTNASLNEQRNQIQQEQENLTKEYQALMDEKGKLSEASKKKTNLKERIEVGREIEKLNEKISQYDNKRKALNEEIEKFNARMSKSEKVETKQ